MAREKKTISTDGLLSKKGRQHTWFARQKERQSWNMQKISLKHNLETTNRYTFHLADTHFISFLFCFCFVCRNEEHRQLVHQTQCVTANLHEQRFSYVNIVFGNSTICGCGQFDRKQSEGRSIRKWNSCAGIFGDQISCRKNCVGSKWMQSRQWHR